MEQLSDREHAILKYVIEYRRESVLGVSPTVVEIKDHLNKILPPGKTGRPAIVSVEQIFRAIRALRKKGYLLDPEVFPEIRGVHRNIVPTSEAAQWYRERGK